MSGNHAATWWQKMAVDFPSFDCKIQPTFTYTMQVKNFDNSYISILGNSAPKKLTVGVNKNNTPHLNSFLVRLKHKLT